MISCSTVIMNLGSNIIGRKLPIEQTEIYRENNDNMSCQKDRESLYWSF